MKKICVKITKSKIIITTLLILSLILVSIYVKASSVSVNPSQDQYFELRAKNINKIEGKDNQVIFELWGHNIEFKGFDVRFTYDTNNFETSNLSTNEYTEEETEFFNFESEFSNCLDFFTIPYDGTSSGGVRAIISFDPPVTESEHIKEKDGIGMVVDTTGDVLIGEMSFRMKSDQFDISSFKLETSDSSPKTGIKINIDGTQYYEAQSTFRFTDKTASKNADLSNLIISTGNKDESSTYKEYSYTPKFANDTLDYELELLENIDNMDITAILSDPKSNMKLKIPKRDENNELIYDSNENTIIYEEKEIEDNTATEITLNKLGEPDTKITVIVTAEDGETIKEYTITIKRPYGIIKGKIFTEPTSFTTEKYIAEVLAYLESDVEEKVNWETAINNTKNYKSDNLNAVFRGDTENSIIGIEEKNKIETKDDGTFEMYLIPGKYTVLIDKKGYLDQYYININIADKDQIDLSAYETSNVITLIPGDINKDGIVEILDKTIMTKQNGKKITDSDFNSSADVNDDDVIDITDKTILTKNNNSVRKIINFGGEN